MNWTPIKVKAGQKKPALLKIFLRLVTEQQFLALMISNAFPAEERSNIPRVGSIESRPF